MTDDVYISKPRPILRPLDIESAQKQLDMFKELENTSKMSRWMDKFKTFNLFFRGRERSALQANNILKAIFYYPDSREFVDKMENEEDFHISNTIANIHVWMVTTRLKHFSEEKYGK